MQTRSLRCGQGPEITWAALPHTASEVQVVRGLADAQMLPLWLGPNSFLLLQRELCADAMTSNLLCLVCTATVICLQVLLSGVCIPVLDAVLCSCWRFFDH